MNVSVHAMVGSGTAHSEVVFYTGVYRSSHGGGSSGYDYGI